MTGTDDRYRPAGRRDHKFRRIARVTTAVTFGLVALAVFLVSSGGEGSNRPSDAPPKAPTGARPPESTVLHGQGVAIASPTTATARAVLFLHGSGQDSRSIFSDPRRRPVTDALLTAGYAVAASDAGLENWGTESGVDAHLDLAAELRRRGYSEIVVLAESMGGLSLPGVVSGVQAKAAAAWYPVCNLQSVISTGRFNEKIARAHGGSLLPPVGLSPVSFAAQPSLHLAIWASPSDTVVPKAENADVCASQARAAGIQVVEFSTTGDHGDSSNLQPENVVSFFNESLR